MSKQRLAILAGIGAAAVALTLGVALTRGGGMATADGTKVAGLTSYVASNSGSENGKGSGL